MGHFAALVWLQTRIVFSYLWVWIRTKIFRAPLSPEQLSAHHRKNARRFKETACRLKGANVKIGQLASMQAHVLPVEYIEELRSLRDAVQPTEFAQIAALIRSELGSGHGELFAELDENPIAAASMAQVHVARLRTGEKVVVKVQHPGLERSVAIDLALMGVLFRVLGFVFRRVDLGVILRESAEPLRRELDLVLEGKATEALARELEPLDVIVPKVYWSHTSRRVLTLEFIEGTNIDRHEQLDLWSVDRAAIVGVYLRAFLHQAFVGGTFHADPHPGNVFCTPEGRLAMLDFGMVKTLPENVRNGLMKEVFGGFFNNPKLYVDGLIEKGAIGEPDRAKVEAWAQQTFSNSAMRGLIFDHQVDKSAAMSLFGGLSELLDLPTFRTPSDNLMFMRALGIVIDVCKEVAPGVSPSALAGPIMMPILADFIAKNPEYA
ncbi:MAG: ABC1 kinase family protein [Polyangiales bacterium]